MTALNDYQSHTVTPARIRRHVHSYSHMIIRHGRTAIRLRGTKEQTVINR